MRIIKNLTEEIGPRVAGTQGEYRASQYIANEFKQLGLDTKVQEFSFLNWTLNEPPRLWVEEPERKEIRVAPMAYTIPTLAKGVTGYLKKVGKMYIIPGYMEWPKYCILGEGDSEQGYLVVNPNGMAAPIPNSTCLLPEAGAVIGKEDAEVLDAWLENGKDVRVKLYNPGHFEPARSQNVIGILGTGQPQIIVCAHYDSVFYSPGAVDNASGIQVIYNIAKRLVSEGGSNLSTIAFIAMGCEEPGPLGSRYYVKWLKERGLLENIHFCVNFDMVGRGERYFLRAGQGTGERLIKILEEGDFKLDHEIKLDTAKASSDNWPFNEENIPNVQVVSLPFPLYHQAEDTMDKLDTTIIQGAEEIGFQLIRTLARKSS